MRVSTPARPDAPTHLRHAVLRQLQPQAADVQPQHLLLPGGPRQLRCRQRQVGDLVRPILQLPVAGVEPEAAQRQACDVRRGVQQEEETSALPHAV